MFNTDVGLVVMMVVLVDFVSWVWWVWVEEREKKKERKIINKWIVFNCIVKNKRIDVD